MRSEQFHDVRSQITTVNEFNNDGATVFHTSYAYDPVRQITSVTDDQGNVTSVAYDLFGRRTAINSPDAGLTTFSYDLADNLTAKQTTNLAANGADEVVKFGEGPEFAVISLEPTQERDWSCTEPRLARTHYPRKLPRVLAPDQFARLVEAAPGPGLKHKRRSPQESWGVFGSRNGTTRKQCPMELHCSGARPERIACRPSQELRPPAATSGY